MLIFDLKNAVLTCKDGTPTTPNTITIKLGDGNLTVDTKRNIEYKLDRGLLDTTRLGDQVPMDVKFECNWMFIKGDSGDTGQTVSIHDAIKGVNTASAWISSDTVNPCAPYALDLILTYTPCGTYKTEILTLLEFRWEDFSMDAKAATLSFTGKCNVQEFTDVRM